ncbi:MAG TPA: HNH endonuclease [Caulobacteraceae bacterium]|nr:HNH endonuclease [Caulobacteraceae bacterium]
MPDAEFDLIIAAGFAPLVDAGSLANRPEISLPVGFGDEPANFERPIIERLTRRPFRDAAFALSVKRAWSDTCALTGLKIINGGGRIEAQAAHIRPVEHAGPDSVRNGMALSATAHWMFDRGLVSVAEDFMILTAKAAAPEALSRLLLPGGRIRPPDRPEWRPHPQFLRWHRENVFKG